MRPSPDPATPATDTAADVVPLPRAAAAAPGDPVELVELQAASIADLVLKLAALAERYEQQRPAGGPAGAEAADARVGRLRAAVDRGRSTLTQLVTAP